MKLPSYRPTSFGPTPAGTYTFEILAAPEQRASASGSTFLIFKLKMLLKNGKKRSYNHLIFPSESRYKNLLICLGGEEDKEGNVHFDDLDFIGKKFQADLVHVEDSKSLKTWEKLINFHPLEVRDNLQESLSGDEEDPY